jgi:hypothetical protein
MLAKNYDEIVNAFRREMHLQVFKYDIGDTFLNVVKEVVNVSSDSVAVFTLERLVLENDEILLNNNDYLAVIVALSEATENVSDYQMRIKSSLAQSAFSVIKLQKFNAYWDDNFKSFSEKYSNE